MDEAGGQTRSHPVNHPQTNSWNYTDGQTRHLHRMDERMYQQALYYDLFKKKNPCINAV